MLAPRMAHQRVGTQVDGDSSGVQSELRHRVSCLLKERTISPRRQPAERLAVLRLDGVASVLASDKARPEQTDRYQNE